MEPLQDICELQEEDEAVGPVLEAVEAAKKPSPDDIAGARNTFCSCGTNNTTSDPRM